MPDESKQFDFKTGDAATLKVVLQTMADNFAKSKDDPKPTFIAVSGLVPLIEAVANLAGQVDSLKAKLPD